MESSDGRSSFCRHWLGCLEREKIITSMERPSIYHRGIVLADRTVGGFFKVAELGGLVVIADGMIDKR